MANMDHECAWCGSKNIRVRISEKIGLLLINAYWYCNSCGASLVDYPFGFYESIKPYINQLEMVKAVTSGKQNNEQEYSIRFFI